MHFAERRDHPESSQAPRSRCLTSPYCFLPEGVECRVAGTDGLWIHSGPIGPETTPLTVHRAARARPDANLGHLELPTPGRNRRFLGCSVDLFGVEQKPGSGARRYVQTVGGSRQVLWVMFAVAWTAPGAVRVSWTAPGFGFTNEGYTARYGTARPGSAHYQEIDRLATLLDGGRRRRGRPSLWENPAWRDIADRAIEKKDGQPSLSWESIAESYKMPVRTLMTWVGLRREELAAGIRLVERGGYP